MKIELERYLDLEGHPVRSFQLLASGLRNLADYFGDTKKFEKEGSVLNMIGREVR